ncbi:hypothetical protein UF64_00160 [Thalassospira sp. HJ]|uniref:DUF6953 family protein n=1 Tax=Thalassospira sp. HJ TaxID=1616823 RepID=UPI0005E42F04|nr:hypothetical protein [Thalassospira sp. HJ]KJE37142.1 hypothetical protein UF64_00160 [Thalassospira sp. HJ]
MATATTKDVAEWLHKQVKQGDYLYHDVAVSDIESKFGSDFIYDNEGGGQSIDKGVLKEFNAISKTDVVWLRSEKAWRLREKGDQPGRMQD